MKRFLLQQIKNLYFSFGQQKVNRNLFLVLVFLGLTVASAVRAGDAEQIGLVTKIMVWLADLITSLALVVGQWVSLMIAGVIIPIIKYNDFVNSPAVGAGWSVVRDIVNMFFVIVFIVIAFGTILGAEKYKWRQQVPHLLLWAIIINFSRTLCGLMIDFSQVFMLTFVNAVKDIAGGNFIQMFGLADILNANGQSAVLSNGTEPFDLLSAALAALLMMMVVFVSLLFFTIALAYRIVMLWVLVTLAPFCWFFKGAEGVLKVGQDPYAKWWTKFKCALLMGPILTFFLWLALAVAGSGDLASTSGFESPASFDAGVLLAALSPTKLVSFIVGILILFAGLDAANDACDASSGGLFTNKVGKAAVGLAGGAALLAGRGSMALGKAGLQKGYKETLGRGVNAAKDLGTDIAGSLAKSNLPGFAKRGFSKIAAKGNADRAARAELAAKEPMAGEDLASYLGDGIGVGANAKPEYIGRLRQAMTDKNFRNKMGPKKMREFMNQRDPITGQKASDLMEETYGGDAGYQKQMEDMKSESPALFGKDNLEKKIKTRKDVEGVDKNQWEDQSFRDHLENVDYSTTNSKGEVVYETAKDSAGNPILDAKTGKERRMNMREALDAGKLDRRMQDLWTEGGTKLRNAGSFETHANKAVKDIDVDDISQGELGREIKDPTTGQSSYDYGLGGRILSNGDDRKVKALMGRDDFQKNKEEYFASALSQTKNSDKRRKLRQMALAQNIDLKKAYEIQDNGQFANDKASDDFQSALNSNPVIRDQALADPDLIPHVADLASASTVGKAVGKMASTSDPNKKRAEVEKLDRLFAETQKKLQEVEREIATTEKGSDRGQIDRDLDIEEKKLSALKKQIDDLEGSDLEVPVGLKQDFDLSSSTVAGLQRNRTKASSGVSADLLKQKERLEQILEQKKENFEPEIDGLKINEKNLAEATRVPTRPSLTGEDLASWRKLSAARTALQEKISSLQIEGKLGSLSDTPRDEIEKQLESLNKVLENVEKQMGENLGKNKTS